MLVGAYDAAVAWHVRAGALGLVAGEVAVGRREEQHVAVRNVPLQPVDPSHCTWGVERRAEFSALGPGAGCFSAPGSGLGLVGTASSRR